MKRCLWLAAVLLPAALSCNTALAPPLVPTFSRPKRVAFVCFDLSVKAAPRVVTFDQCKRTVNDKGEVVTPPGTLHALVTQSDRGEVAAVDLINRTVIDSREDIPGYTFVPVGELPGPIVVPPNHPQFTYVANTGSRDISVLSTAAFRSLQTGQSATVQRLSLKFGDAETPVAPFDMVLSPDEDALFVSATEAGQLLRLPLQRCQDLTGEAKASCHEGEIDVEHVTSVPLAASISKAQPVVPPEGNEVEPYVQCAPPLELPVPMAQAYMLPPLAADAKPEPSGLAIDAFCAAGSEGCARHLLVADKSLPLIHVVDLDRLGSAASEDAVLQPIITAVPTQRVAVTPRVPASVDADGGEVTQYVYAIDATDSSVLVARDGRVINVSASPTRRHDRLDLGLSQGTGELVAVSLAVLTPNFDVTDPSAQWATHLPVDDANNPADPATWLLNQPDMCWDTTFPRRRADRLRGVFLAVGFTDGSVRLVDVHDEELAHCRDCVSPKDADLESAVRFDPYPVRRNRARIGATYAIEPTYYNDAPPALSTPQPRNSALITPTVSVDNNQLTVNSNGLTGDARLPGLDCIQCPAAQSVAFPADNASSDTGSGTADAASGGVAGEVTAASPGEAGHGGSAAGGGAGASGGAAGSAGSAGQGGANAPVACAPDEGRVCSLQDPSIDPVGWYARYEGNIPGTNGGRGRFIESDSADNRSGQLEFVGEARFCDTGVLGSQDIADDRVGDQVQITSALPPLDVFKDAHPELKDDPGELAALRADCDELVRARDSDNQPIAFRIEQAYADRLVIGGKLLHPLSNTRGHATDYTLVNACFLNMLMSFEVHVSQSYAVYRVATVSGDDFLHRVITDPDSMRCKLDAMQDARRTGRAYDGFQFDNGFVSFQVSSSQPPEVGTRLFLEVGNPAPKMAVNIAIASGGTVYGATPVDIEFNPADQNLYIVDGATRGLLQYSLSPITPVASYQ